MMKTDIEIAQECTMEPITKVAEKAGIPEEYLEQYGKYKAKIDYNFLKKSDKKDGKLILVTAINPTPAGEGKTTTVAGPSGVGKSSMLNALTKDYKMETGAISEKIGRGKHTTRHSEIFNIDSNSYVFDTPGFSSLFVPGMTKEKLQYCFPEMPQYEPECRFTGCAHINEPDCGIKNALEQGKIARERYENYVLLYKELEQLEKNKEKYSYPMKVDIRI